MNVVQYVHPFYYNFHKFISNMQYPHIGLIMVAGFFLQPLQYSHIGFIIVVRFFTTIVILAYKSRNRC
jgi:hypothetical protein